jgi:mRNA-degrading endonuclease RelE of RelBE toxin-antitoxin system
MSYKILPTHQFAKELKRLVKKYPSLKAEYSHLIDQISLNPKTGSPLGHNCFKVRIAIKSKGKGKSGGARTITYVYLKTETVYLLRFTIKVKKLI